jgi:hypothetical protein
MVLAFDNAGSFAKAVYGENQHAGANGAIAMSEPVPKMTGGNKSRRNRKDRKDRKNKSRNRRNRRNSRRNQNGGK